MKLDGTQCDGGEHSQEPCELARPALAEASNSLYIDVGETLSAP